MAEAPSNWPSGVNAAVDQLVWFPNGEPAPGVSDPVDGSTENTHKAPGHAAASWVAPVLNAIELAAPLAAAANGDPGTGVSAPVA